MIDRFLVWLITRRLRAVLANFTPANLDIQLQQGCLELKDLLLTPELTRAWGLPAALSTADVTVRRLELLLPWRASRGEDPPFVVNLDVVRIVLRPHSAPTLAQSKRAALRRDRQRLLQEAAEEATPLHPTPDPPFGAAAQQKLIDALLRSLQVSVTDVVVRYEDGADGAAVEAHLDSLQLDCQREHELSGWLAFCLPRRGAREQRCHCSMEAVVAITWHALHSDKVAG